MKRIGLVAAGVILTTVHFSGVSAEDALGCSFSVDENKRYTPMPDCSAYFDAAATPQEKAERLYRVAYELNEHDSAVAALPLLDRAVELEPGNANYWHERGYTHNDLGYFREGLKDLDAAIALRQSVAQDYEERELSHTSLGLFEAAVADQDKAIDLAGESPARLATRAADYVWLGRLDEAEADLDKLAGNPDWAKSVSRQRQLIARMRAYKPDGDPAKLCELPDQLSDKDAAGRLFDAYTRAFLKAGDAPTKAKFLIFRSATRVLMEGGFGGAVEDEKVAVGLDPNNGDWHTDFGNGLLEIHQSWAARNEFDAALKLLPPGADGRAYALAGQAMANYNLQDRDAAFADGKASFEAKPNPQALDVLGVLALDRGDKKTAKSFWMGEYHMGIRDDGLLTRLKSVGVNNPDSEPKE